MKIIPHEQHAVRASLQQDFATPASVPVPAHRYKPNRRASGFLSLFLGAVSLIPASLAAGPYSGYSWFSGSWANGADIADFAAFRNNTSDGFADGVDVVTQSQGINASFAQWYEIAGCTSDQQVTTEIGLSPTDFLNGLGSAVQLGSIFGSNGGAVRSAIWNNAAHRARKIHFCWMVPVPTSQSNANGANPALWFNIRNGSADKYYYLLGRKFAALDQQAQAAGKPVIPTHGMTIDFAYEFTLSGKAHFAGGVHAPTATPAYVYFKPAFLRMIKAFKQGYNFQRGLSTCPYKFCWRPQAKNAVIPDTANPVNLTAMFPNDSASFNVASAVVVNGRTVMPAGALGNQVDLIGISWHDSFSPQVQGSTNTAPGSNWSTHLWGSGTLWGLLEAKTFAQNKGVKMCMPEWAPRSDLSTHPGDVIRMMRHFITQAGATLDYECYFNLGEGEIANGSGAPVLWGVAAAQEPATVYRTEFP